MKRRSLAILVAIVAFIPMRTPAVASEVATMDAFGTTITWNSPVSAPTGNRPCVSLVMRVDVGPAPTVPGIELQLVSGVPGAYKSLSEHQFVSLPPVGGSVPAVLEFCFTTYASHDPPYALTVRPLAGAAPLWQRNFTDVVATQIDLREPRILSYSSVSSGRVVLNAHEIVVLRTCWQEGMVSRPFLDYKSGSKWIKLTQGNLFAGDYSCGKNFPNLVTYEFRVPEVGTGGGKKTGRLEFREWCSGSGCETDKWTARVR